MMAVDYLTTGGQFVHDNIL